MKKALYIDFDGTLCFDRFWMTLKNEDKDEIQKVLFRENAGLVADWMKGIHTSEHINKLVADELGLNYQDLWNGFVEGCKNMMVDQEDLEQIKRLNSKFTTILITDNMDCFERFTVPSLRLDSCFNHIISSSSEGVSKNQDDGYLFRMIAERTGISIGESILVDNSEDTCSLFKRLGGTSLLVSEYKPLISYLIKL